jgi:hypothetical protein
MPKDGEQKGLKNIGSTTNITATIIPEKKNANVAPEK